MWKGTFSERQPAVWHAALKLGGKLAHIHARYVSMKLVTDRARVDRALRQLQSIRKAARVLREFADQVNDQSDELAGAIYRRTAPEPAKLPRQLFENLEAFAKRQVDEYGRLDKQVGISDDGETISVQERLIVSLATVFEKSNFGEAKIVNWNRSTKLRPDQFERFVIAFCEIMKEPRPSHSTIEKALTKRKLPQASLEAHLIASLRREATRKP